MVDVAFEDVRDDLLSDVRVKFAFLSRRGHAFREALERKEGWLVMGWKKEMRRHVGIVNLPVDDGQFPRLAGMWQATNSMIR